MAEEKKKDLTALMDYAKAMQDSGLAPPPPAGSVMEEQKIEKIDDFESLEEYGKANPAPEISEEAPAPPDPAPTPEPLADFAPAGDFAVTETPAPTPEFATSDFAVAPATPAEEPIFNVPTTPVAEPTAPAPSPPAQERLRPAAKSPSVEQPPLERLRQYSEQYSPAKQSVPAAFPFSVLITGHLAPEERERLLGLLSRENLGIRELDLEPQFEAGQVLIPRISEYAAVLIVSALRSARAKIRVGPSDTIFATEDTRDDDTSDDASLGSGQRHSDAYARDPGHPAERLPITSEGRLPGQVEHAILDIVDIVTASAALKTLALEAESSPEYQRLLDALQREIKYKAFRKGADAIVSFSVQLTQLHVPTHYRVLVTGSAIRKPS